MNPQEHHVVVLGASPKPGRYANQAVRLLKEKGYQVTPVHPNFAEIEALPVINDIANIDTEVHTLTLYVGADRLASMVDSIVALQPQRVIFNPGTESSVLQQSLDQHNIEWLEGCTLVMLKTNVF